VIDSLDATDADLVVAVRAGDTTAFGDLYRRHVQSVTRTVAAKLSGREAVADAVQDTFTKALERLDALRDPDKFRPWLLSIARHAAVDSRRARGWTILDGEAGGRAIDGGPGPEQLAELSELVGLVNGCVGGLSGRDATAMAMVTQFGFSPTEIGAAMGLTPNAAKVMLHRARRRMRDALVLELMVRGRGAGCADLQELLAGEGQLLAAGAHVSECAVCRGAALAEVGAFGLDTSPGGRTMPDSEGGGSSDQDASLAAELLAKVRGFVASLDEDERSMFAALIAPGISGAYLQSDVEGFALLDWDAQALPQALADVIRTHDIRIQGLTD